jgi:hypothetical protein
LAKDKIFHQSEFFRNAQHEVSVLLDQQGQWPRKWFFNHVFTEIVLDRVLMDANPQLCQSFYDDLKAVDAPTVAHFLELAGVQNHGIFAQRFLKFIEYQFIFDYQHNEKINLALSQLYRRVGIDYDWTPQDHALIQAHLPKIIGIIAEQLENLTKELKNA